MYNRSEFTLTFTSTFFSWRSLEENLDDMSKPVVKVCSEYNLHEMSKHCFPSMKCQILL